MKTIAALEATGREVYTGAIGYLSPHAGLELSVAIRTLEVSGGHAWLGAGGGIVAQSDPETELQEALTKARPVLAALGAATPDPTAWRRPPAAPAARPPASGPVAWPAGDHARRRRRDPAAGGPPRPARRRRPPRGADARRARGRRRALPGAPRQRARRGHARRPSRAAGSCVPCSSPVASAIASGPTAASPSTPSSSTPTATCSRARGRTSSSSRTGPPRHAARRRAPAARHHPRSGHRGHSSDGGGDRPRAPRRRRRRLPHERDRARDPGQGRSVRAVVERGTDCWSGAVPSTRSLRVLVMPCQYRSFLKWCSRCPRWMVR